MGQNMHGACVGLLSWVHPAVISHMNALPCMAAGCSSVQCRLPAWPADHGQHRNKRPYCTCLSLCKCQPSKFCCLYSAANNLMHLDGCNGTPQRSACRRTVAARVNGGAVWSANDYLGPIYCSEWFRHLCCVRHCYMTHDSLVS